MKLPDRLEALATGLSSRYWSEVLGTTCELTHPEFLSKDEQTLVIRRICEMWRELPTLSRNDLERLQQLHNTLQDNILVSVITSPDGFVGVFLRSYVGVV